MSFKNILKYLSLLLILSIITITSTSFAKAADLDLQTKAEMFLKKIGTPEEIISQLEPWKVEQFYLKYGNMEYLKFSGYDKQILDVSENSVSEGTPQTYGNIPTSQLQLSILTVDNYNPNTNVVSSVIVELNYKWLKRPFFTMTDAMTFNWDSNLFVLKGFYAQSGYMIRDMYNRNQWAEVEFINSPARSTSGGIGWYLETGRNITVPPSSTVISNNQGAASILLHPKRTIYTNTTLNSDMHFNYAHQILGTNISLGISSGGPSAGVSFSGGSYDELAAYYTYH